MFLKTLRLRNVRCFEDAEIDFDLPGGDNRKWTVLVGENGSGKTTILQAIALIMSGASALPGLIGDVDSWIRIGADQAQIDAEIETAKGVTRSISLILRRGDTPEKVAERSIESASDLNRALEHTSRNYLTIGFGAARRHADDPAMSEQHIARYVDPRARSLASLFDREVPLQPLEQWIAELTSDTSQTATRIVTDLVETFLPEVKFSRIGEDGSILFQTADGEVALQHMGNGYQTLTAFVGDLLYQITTIFGDFKDPLKARGLILIDSLAQALHPSLQRRVVAFLDEWLPRLQIVATTQSLVITQQSPADALHYCIRRKGPAVIEQFEGEPRKLRLNQLMMTEAFGEGTYESLEVEAQKERFRELENITKRTSAQTREMNRLQQQIGQVPMEDIGVGMTAEQLKLLEDVKAALGGKS